MASDTWHVFKSSTIGSIIRKPAWLSACQLSLAAILLLTACVDKQSQSNYRSDEIGVSYAIEYGTVINIRDVTINRNSNNTTGTLLGAGTGAGAGSYIGDDSGNAWAVAGGAVLGAIIGHEIERNLNKSEGYEYTLAMQGGESKVIAFEKIEGEPAFKPGDKVMLQYCDAGKHYEKCKSGKQFQRLAAVNAFPPEVKKTKKRH